MDPRPLERRDGASWAGMMAEMLRTRQDSRFRYFRRLPIIGRIDRTAKKDRQNDQGNEYVLDLTCMDKKNQSTTKI